MSAYRSDLEAALARNHDLERRVHELEHAMAPEAPQGVVPIATLPTRGGDQIGALVAAKERTAIRRRDEARQAEAHVHQVRVARLARRPRRVTIGRGADFSRTTVARPLVRDALRDQLAWGIVFSAINPGVFIMGAFGVVFAVLGVPVVGAITLAVVTWAVVLLGINVVYAWFRHPVVHVDITDDGHFAVHTGDPRTAKLIGRARALKVHASTAPDPAELHCVTLEQGVVEYKLEFLSHRDVADLRAALARS